MGGLTNVFKLGTLSLTTIFIFIEVVKIVILIHIAFRYNSNVTNKVLKPVCTYADYEMFVLNIAYIFSMKNIAY